VQSTARDSYLAAQVLPAPPQKLQLMLIDGAIRQIHLAREHWQRQENDDACEALIRAQGFVTEVIKGLDRDAAPELAGKIAGVYLFVFRRLLEANLRRNDKALDEALRVLEVERQTWLAVCEQLASRPAQGPSAPHLRTESARAAAVQTALPASFLPEVDSPEPGGLTLEA